MPMPTGLKAIDLMMNIPDGDPSAWYEFIKPLLLDEESRNQFKMPAQYMFKDIPEVGDQKDFVQYAIGEMDKWGIERAMLGISGPNSTNLTACKKHPTRFFPSYGANPNNGMEEVRAIRRLHKEHGLKAVTGFPSGLCPQVPLNDKKYYPIYGTSAFAPKHYPKAIIDYANTRGADKIMYAGYFPMGLSLERIFTDMRNVPFKEHVWPKFLSENAMRVFQLDR
jgi:predicted TIM-barrel fold metal-dependent hydrolase